jgi:MoxR-like ATPase
MNHPARALSSALDTTHARAAMERVERNLARAVAGKDDELRLSVACLVARGHLLLEDVPGVGKTTLAEAIARSFGLSFARVQFTSDLMPADILGAQVFQPQSSTFELRKGPLFHQLVLADELNRAPPRTQSALLEAMAQGQASLDGVTHRLPAPFVVVATQNPTDLAGTYPLPDSQLDRFLMRISLGHPSPEIEAMLLRTRALEDPLRGIEAASSPDELIALQGAASRVVVGEAVAGYAVRLAETTRQHPEIERGASTRALLSLVNAARAHALREGRSFATPADVRRMLAPCLSHRLLLRSAVMGTFSRDEAVHLLDEIVRAVPEPK